MYQAQLREVRGKGLYKFEKTPVEHAAYKQALVGAATYCNTL